jgi:DNA repair exonuclease SbcCD nuclease subunit
VRSRHSLYLAIRPEWPVETLHNDRLVVCVTHQPGLLFLSPPPTDLTGQTGTLCYMARILCVGDTHLTASSLAGPLPAAIIRAAEEIRPDLVVLLGDVLDEFEYVQVDAQQCAYQLFQALARVAPLYVLVGNHDRPNNSDFLSSRHPFTALVYWPVERITIVHRPVQATCQGHILTFVPYVPPGCFRAALEGQNVVRDAVSGSWRAVNETVAHPGTTTVQQLETASPVPSEVGPTASTWRDSTIIFAHQEFHGGWLGHTVSTVGDPWPVMESHPQTHQLARLPLVISGHLHDYHTLPNVWYVGTPYQQRFGEAVDKALLLITLTSSEPREQRGVAHALRHPLALPLKVEVHLTVEQLTTYQLPANQQTKIIVSAPLSSKNVVMKSGLVQSWKDQGVKVVFRGYALEVSNGLDMTSPPPASGPTDFATNVLRAGEGRVSFATQLWRNTTPELRDLYVELFGMPTTT